MAVTIHGAANSLHNSGFEKAIWKRNVNLYEDLRRKNIHSIRTS